MLFYKTETIRYLKIETIGYSANNCLKVGVLKPRLGKEILFSTPIETNEIYLTTKEYNGAPVLRYALLQTEYYTILNPSNSNRSLSSGLTGTSMINENELVEATNVLSGY